MNTTLNLPSRVQEVHGKCEGSKIALTTPLWIALRVMLFQMGTVKEGKRIDHFIDLESDIMSNICSV